MMCILITNLGSTPALIALGECSQSAVHPRPTEAAGIAATVRTNVGDGHPERLHVADDVTDDLVRSSFCEHYQPLVEAEPVRRQRLDALAVVGAVGTW
jgi:hypothetical protein